jgi:microcompartment protein CcmK/EutM
MTEQRIARVPQRIWADGRPAQARNWESEFNMASWIRLTGLGGQVQLVIRHRDEAGEHVTPVDSVDAGSQESVLLSGVVRLRFQGRVEEVDVDVKAADETLRYEVDELFMQRRQSVSGRENKLISNF